MRLPVGLLVLFILIAVVGVMRGEHISSMSSFDHHFGADNLRSQLA
jgi:hypothetical protein